MKKILDSTAHAFGEDDFNVKTLDAWVLAMARTDGDLISSQENGWKEMINYQTNYQGSDQWGSNPSRLVLIVQNKNNIFTHSYVERDVIHLVHLQDRSPTSLTVFERCNFASNFAYYNLMYHARKLVWVSHDTKKALVQASAGLTLSSSFFHASHTQLGQLLDNLMIKIIAYTLYDAYITSLELPNTTPLLVSKLTEAGRPKTGIELAQDLTDMFRTQPSNTWTESVQRLDVPRYERTFGALILTMYAHAKAGALTNWWNDVMLSKLPIEQEDKTFLRKFNKQIKDVFKGRKVARVEKADRTNKMTTGLKFVLAFIFQENYEGLALFRSFIDGIGLRDLNNYLSSLNTLPIMKSTLAETRGGRLKILTFFMFSNILSQAMSRDTQESADVPLHMQSGILSRHKDFLTSFSWLMRWRESR